MIPRNDKKSWPLLLDMTKDECKQTLRALELSTYSKIVSVLRAQGELTKEKRKILSDLQSVFSISVERHRAEIRRAVNDELLNTIAEMLAGPNTDIEWAVEGRRLVPLLPRAPPQVAYTALATKMAQLYCGINTQLKSPCETSMCGKLDDLGADSEMTDSEDETEGLRFITQSMVPQQYNADQGSYTTLPFSQEKLSKDKVLKEKKENAEEPTQEATPPSPPFLSSSMSSESNASTNSQGKQVVANAVEKRKRKRSITDHPIPHSPPPPPVPTSLPIFTAPSTGTSIQGIQTTANTIRQLPNIGSSMKISVTGGITKTSSSGPISTSTQQKVILVSTSAASGSVGSMYQRSISVPILKSTSLNTAGGTLPPALGVPISSQSGLFRNNVAATSTTTTMSVTSSAVNKIRPRFTSSILSQGSSSLPGLPPRPVQRPRSNSLVLHSEGDNICAKSLSGSSQGQSTSSEPGSANSSSLSYIAPNTLQLRPGPSISSKSNIQVKQQDGGKRIAHAIVSSSNTGTSSIVSTGTITSTATSGSGSVPSVVGGRIIGRASLPSSSQGLYVVSTSSGTITVVTRTVASAALSNPRVVTMNTISNSRPGIIRGPATTSVMSVGMTPKSVSTMRQTGSIRPVMSASKSNVIVVHKGTIGSGARPVGIQGLRDLSTKIIKPTSQGISSSISGGSSGILSGTLVVKPSPPSKGGIASTSSSTSISSNSSSFISTGSVSSNSVTTTFSSSSGNNLIVVDLNCESSSSSQGSVLQPPGGTPSNTVKNSHSLFSSGSKNLAEATPSLQSIQVRKEPSSSHEISTVSASSSLPSTFRVFKSSLLPSDREEMEVEAGSTVSSEKVEEDRVPISNLVSSTSDVRDSVDAPDEGYARGEGKTHHHSISSLSLEEHEEEEEEDDDEEMEEEDNEWLKLGLEDEDDPELEEEDEEEERNSDASSGTEKSAMAAEDSIENEADGGEEVIRTPRSEQVDMKESKPGTSGEASVSSSTGAGNEKEGEIQMLVEKAVEVLKGGDSDQARTLLYKAGFELIDSSSDPEQGPGTVELQDGYSISNIAGVSSSSAMLCSGTPLSASTPLRDESSLGSMSELDPTTGYFYSPSGGENSSEPTSNRADSPVTKEEDSLAVPEFEDEN